MLRAEESLILLTLNPREIPRLPDRQAGFGKALVANHGIAMREQLANFRAVFCDKRFDLVKIFHIHGALLWAL